MGKMKTDISLQADSCILMWVSDIGAATSDGSLNSHEVEVFTGLAKIAAASPDREVCGYIERVHDDAPWITMRFIGVENIADDDSGEFMFPPEFASAVYDLLDKGDCLGIWHSHPNGKPEPSITDWIGHPRDPACDMYIVVPIQGRKHKIVSIYRYTEDDRP